LSSALFLDITQCTAAIRYRRLGTTYWSRLQGSRSWKSLSSWPWNCHYTLRNILEGRRSHLHSGGSLKPRPCLSFGTETFGHPCGREDVYCKEVGYVSMYSFW